MRAWALHHVSHLLVEVTTLGGFARCRQNLCRIKELMADLPFILIHDDRAFDLGIVAQTLLSRLPARAQPKRPRSLTR